MSEVHGPQGVPRMPVLNRRVLKCPWRGKMLCVHVLTFFPLSPVPGYVTADILGVLLP